MATPNTKDFLQGLSIDCVIFGFHANELKILLLKLKNMEKWALPGGFVGKDEDVDQAVSRVLRERTGLEGIFLQQFHFFGEADRSNHEHAAKIVAKDVIPKELFDWFNQRFITLGHYALVEYSKVKDPSPDYTSEVCEWRPISNLPELMLDHHKIFSKAHETLKRHLNYEPIGMNLLPKQFTMPELQALYETLLGRKLDRRNFQRKMLSYDIFIQTGKRRTGGAHKAPWLYEFDEEKYQQALLDGLKTGW